MNRILMGCILAATICSSASADELRGRVVEASLKTYIHGMTAQIADEEIGVEGVPALHQLLADGNFPRRDNVIAFLAYLGDDESAQVVHDYLSNPPADVDNATEDRALLLAPHALGHMARRGNAKAESLLLEMTADGNSGGVLGKAAAKSSRAQELRDGLIEQAVRALRIAGTSATQKRQAQIAQGQVNPGSSRSAQQAASDTEEIQEGFDNGTASGDLSAIEGQNMIDHALTCANHTTVASPMTDSRLDAILAAGSTVVNRVDYSADVSCCTKFHRRNPCATFGSSGDGLDTLDNSTDTTTVLTNPIARVKVVRAINWCGSPGTNIIGCGYNGGNGIAVVRYGSETTEGALWVHEYGHNVGLGHNSSNSRLIMYPVLSANDGLTQTDCDKYILPTSGAQAETTTTEICTNGDPVEVCGNGVIGGTEQCDGADLGGDTCASLGFDGGTLGCTSSCTLNTSGCRLCGNGVRETGEQCDGTQLGGATCGSQGCASGAPTCTSTCTLSYDSCGGCPVCDNDGVCEQDEACDGCPNDCIAGSGSVCGNSVCETGNGEDCLTCPSDCNGNQGGKPSGRWCCGFGGTNPLGCGDSRCGADCTENQVSSSCCGDLSCGGIENSSNCSLDCGAPPPPPICGDGSCAADETACNCPSDCGTPPSEVCSDGIDNDCDGAVDCSDSNCDSSSACSCQPVGSNCDSHSDCCSFNCKGKSGSKTCK